MIERRLGIPLDAGSRPRKREFIYIALILILYIWMQGRDEKDEQITQAEQQELRLPLANPCETWIHQTGGAPEFFSCTKASQ